MKHYLIKIKNAVTYKSFSLLFVASFTLIACGNLSVSGDSLVNCQATPFHADCSFNTNAVQQRQDICLDNTNMDARCDMIIDTHCTGNLFSDKIACRGEVYQNLREEACIKNPMTNADCSSVIDLDNFVDVTDLPNYNDLPTSPDDLVGTETPNRGFLQGIGNHQIGNEVGSEKLGIITYRRVQVVPKGRAVTENDSYNDGFGFVLLRSYGIAAIFSTTNLGAPLPIGADQPANAVWQGRYALSKYVPNSRIIDFMINFQTGKIDATAQLTCCNDFVLDAVFDKKGVVTGDFNSTETPSRDRIINGKVIGLIGEQGLVGVMHGESVTGDPIAGGFIADNPDHDN